MVANIVSTGNGIYSNDRVLLNSDQLFNTVTGKKQTMLANQKFLRNASRHKRYDDDDDDDDKWVVVNSDS